MQYAGGLIEHECPRCHRAVELPFGALCRQCVAELDRHDGVDAELDQGLAQLDGEIVRDAEDAAGEGEQVGLQTAHALRSRRVRRSQVRELHLATRQRVHDECGSVRRIEQNVSPALEIPDRYKAASWGSLNAPPLLDWWRGFRSSELTTLMEEAQTVNLDIAAATAWP